MTDNDCNNRGKGVRIIINEVSDVNSEAVLGHREHDILVIPGRAGAVAPLHPKSKSGGYKLPKEMTLDEGRILICRPSSAGEIACPILMPAKAAGGNVSGRAIVVDDSFSISC